MGKKEKRFEGGQPMGPHCVQRDRRAQTQRPAMRAPPYRRRTTKKNIQTCISKAAWGGVSRLGKRRFKPAPMVPRSALQSTRSQRSKDSLPDSIVTLGGVALMHGIFVVGRAQLKTPLNTIGRQSAMVIQGRYNAIFLFCSGPKLAMISRLLHAVRDERSVSYVH